MFQKGFFKNASREKIRKAMEEDGFPPMTVTDPPNFVYEPHQHEETNYLACLEGSMHLTVNNKPHHFEPGDKLIIPANTIHFGKVSPQGCTYFFSAKKD